jgi:hypothetical protein
MMRSDDPDRETEYQPPPVSDELPRRPRRRLLTPVALVLAAVTVAALGFIGGVLVQKAQGGSGSGSQIAAGPPGFAGRAGGGAVRGGGATAGSVVNKRGKYLYVRVSSGNTVRVKTTSNSKVTRTASSKVRAVHPGDTVTIEGTKGRDGTITAARITATAKGSSSGGFPGGGFPGGGVPGGAPGAAAGSGAAGAAAGG